jgi:hypothetical protein
MQLLLSYQYICMQEPTEEASIPTENERNGPTLSGVRHKVLGIRSLPWETAAAENLVSLSSSPPPHPPPQYEDIPAAKKPRLQTSTAEDKYTVVDAHANEAATTASPDDTVAGAPPGAITVVPSIPIAGALRARAPRRSWKPEEDSMMIEAVKKFGNNWIAVATLLPGRTNVQCREKWAKYLDPTIEQPTPLKKGKWTAEEDAKLTDAVKKFSNDWVQNAALVPGRTNVQCRQRWTLYLDPIIDRATPLKNCKWTPEEDAKLTEAVRELGNDWVQVAAMVPDRTNIQCRYRWDTYLDPTIDRTTAYNKGKWTVEEDAKLTDVVKKHGGNNWIAVAALVLGRTNQQCHQRWSKCLDPNIKNGKWLVEEDTMLIDAVKEHGGSNWATVSALVLGRTDMQCRQRWVEILDPGINTGKWTPEEDAILTDAVTEFGNDWGRVAVLVPGRTKARCRHRWVKHLDLDRSTNSAEAQCQ